MEKTVVIYHSNDFDGIFCREIAKKFLGTENVTYIGWDYGNPPIKFEHLQDANVYVLDLPCDAPVGAKFPEDGSKTIDMKGRYYGSKSLVWIDHHRTSIESHPKDAITIPGYRIDGVAACRLAWQWFTLDKGPYPNTCLEIDLPTFQEFKERRVVEPLAVRLAGEYDIWDKRDERAELFQHGLRSRELKDSHWATMLDTTSLQEPNAIVYELLKGGESIQYAKNEENKGIIETYGFTGKLEGLTFLCCNHARFNSQLFTAGVKPEHDALLGFNYNGKDHWRVSLYHAPGKEHHDLSVIAKKYEGGGHKGAAGFVIHEYNFQTWLLMLKENAK